MARRRRRFYPYVAIALVILAGYWAAFAFTIAVDPLDVYRWGPTPRIGENIAVNDQLELMLPRSADPGTDLLILGDSTSATYSEDQIRGAIPNVRHIANLSYGFHQLGDTELLLRRIEQRSKAPWIILFMGPSYLTPIESMRAGAPVYLLNDTPWDDMRYVNPQNMMLALDVVRGRPIYGARSDRARFRAQAAARQAAFQTEAEMRKLGERLAASRGKLAAQPMRAGCDDQVAVNRVLAPFLRTMSQRGVRVDVVFTLTSRAVYGQVVEDPSAIKLYPRNMFAGESMLRRCAVRAAGALPHIAFHAFDDDRIVGDLANYMDTAHLRSDPVVHYVFGEIARGGHRVTPATVDRYIAEFRSRTIAYRGYNSSFPALAWPDRPSR